LPLLSSGLAISAFSSFYNDIYNKPNIQIEITGNEMDRKISTVEISNNGRVPAKGTTITIETPEIITGYKIFHTENITFVNSTKQDTRILELYLPRLVNGDGSFIKILIVNAKKIMDYTHYNVYVTYDQGSVKVGAVKRILTLQQQLNEFSTSGWTSVIFLLVATITTALPPIIAILVRLVRRRRAGRISYITKYIKIIDSTYNTFKENKQECLKQLNELQNEINHLFIKGTINEMKYTILNTKISIYLSRLQEVMY
jgi:hypothetical protein